MKAIWVVLFVGAAFAQQAPVGDVYESGGGGAQTPVAAFIKLRAVAEEVVNSPGSDYQPGPNGNFPQPSAVEAQWDQAMGTSGNQLTQAQRQQLIPCAAHLRHAIDEAERGYLISISQPNNPAAQQAAQNDFAAAQSAMSLCSGVNANQPLGSQQPNPGSNPGATGANPVQTSNGGQPTSPATGQQPSPGASNTPPVTQPTTSQPKPGFNPGGSQRPPNTGGASANGSGTQPTTSQQPNPGSNPGGSQRPPITGGTSANGSGTQPTTTQQPNPASNPGGSQRPPITGGASANAPNTQPTTTQQPNPASNPGGSQRPPITGGASTNGPTLTPQDLAKMHKLAAEMNDLAHQPSTGNPAVEFAKGLADWAGQTLTYLAQKPGVPLQQAAQAIANYLTNDNAANHRVLRAAAEKAVQQFEQNPARFLGQNAPNFIPWTALSKIKALSQIAKVESAATRLEAAAQAERSLATTFEEAMQDAPIGAQAAANPRFSFNACLQTALAKAQLLKERFPLGTGGVRVQGVYPLGPGGITPRPNMGLNFPQTIRKLQPYGENFAPRIPGSFNPEQLDQIWKGVPINVDGPDEIRKLLGREGPGSQGVVITFTKRMGHAFNAFNDGVVQFADDTNYGRNPLGHAPQVVSWFFFPLY